MKKLIKYLTSLADQHDAASSMRWLMLMNFVISSTILWGIWMAMCLVKSQVVDVPPGLSNLYLTVNGMAISGKVVQTISENWTKSKNPDPSA